MPDERVPADENTDLPENVDSAEESDHQRWYEDRVPEEEAVRADPNELVTIATFGTAYEADMAKMHLDELNIPTFLDGIEIDVMLRLWGMGDIKLQVRRSDAEAAMAALAERGSSSSAEPEETESDVSECLSCGQSLPEEATACPACGWSYADDQETRFRAE